MKSYLIKDLGIQISVFPKTGTSFMDSMVEDYNTIDFLSDRPNEIFKYNSKEHLISLRDPFDRFITGFITYHKRKESDVGIIDLFLDCYNTHQNNWDFDDHTKNFYVNSLTEIPKNVNFFDYKEIGSILNSYGFSYPNNHRYLNDNPIESKDSLRSFIEKNPKVFKDILYYLSPDIQIYQKLKKVVDNI